MPEEGTILMNGFEDAFVGGLRKVGQKYPIAVYDYQGCIDILMTRDQMSQDEAVEFIESNSLNAYFGKGTPCMVYGCTLDEFKQDCADDIVETVSEPRDPDEDEDEEDADRDPGDEDPNAIKKEDEEEVAEALWNLFMNFSEYVKQIDPDLFARAKNYAMDYSQTDRVKFVDEWHKEGDEEKKS